MGVNQREENYYLLVKKCEIDNIIKVKIYIKYYGIEYNFILMLYIFLYIIFLFYEINIGLFISKFLK